VLAGPSPIWSNRSKQERKSHVPHPYLQPAGQHGPDAEDLEQIYGGAGRRSFRPTLEGLEDRQLLAANVTATLTAGVLNVKSAHIQGTPLDDLVSLRRTADNKIQVLGGAKPLSIDASQVKALEVLMGGGQGRLDLTGLGKLNSDLTFQVAGGTAAVNYIDQAGRKTRRIDTTDGYKIYQQWAEVWRLVQYNHKVFPGSQTWCEESWAADGSTYTKNVWTKKDHGAAESNDHLSGTVMNLKDGVGTTTIFHAKDIPYASSKLIWNSSDARVTMVFKIDATGKIEDMLSYEVRPNDAGSRFTNRWTQKDGWNVAEPWKGWGAIYNDSIRLNLFMGYCGEVFNPAGETLSTLPS
jgi:hypothetical protein